MTVRTGFTLRGAGAVVPCLLLLPLASMAADQASTTQPESLPAESPMPDREYFDEDQLAGARVDNEFPPGQEGLEGYFQVHDTSTWLRIGGYAKLDAMYDTDEAGVRDLFIPSAIPVGGQSGDASFNMHARQTRLTIEGLRRTGMGWLRFKLQNDFFGPGDSYGYNLRHAWGQLGNTYVGYGFSAFMDLDSGPDTLDFAGPGVIPFARIVSIRQYVPLKDHNQLIFAAEHVDPEITSTIPDVESRTTAPNLVFAYRHEGGSGHLQAGALLRQLAYTGVAGSDETMAGGLSLSGSWSVSGSTYLTYGGLAGRGIAGYIGDLIGLGLDGIVEPDGSLQALEEWGGWIGAGHSWRGGWKSTLAFGRLYLEENVLLGGGDFRRSDYAALNLIRSPERGFSYGVEVLYGRQETQANQSGDAFRLQASLKYDFF